MKPEICLSDSTMYVVQRPLLLPKVELFLLRSLYGFVSSSSSCDEIFLVFPVGASVALAAHAHLAQMTLASLWTWNRMITGHAKVLHLLRQNHL